MKKFIQNLAMIIIFSGLIFTAEIAAQLEGNPENFCRNGFFPRDSKTYQIAKIKGKPKEKVYFYGDEREDCPQNKNCRLKSYVVPNDEVIVSRTFGDFACVWFQPEKGSETVGWIYSKNLSYLPKAGNLKVNDWIGHWYFYDNTIEISVSKKRGFLGISGNAVWKGSGDNVHIGEIDEDEAAPNGNILEIGKNETDEFACKVSMQLLGKYLLVSDNLNCGGVNVTFSGIYRNKGFPRPEKLKLQ